MFPNAKVFAAVVSCALLSAAQVTTSSSAAASQTSSPAGQLDSCIITCLTQAEGVAGSCSDYTDTACVCINGVFQQSVATCLATECTAADAATAQQLQQQQCGGTAAPTGTGSATAGVTVSSAIGGTSGGVSTLASTPISTLASTPVATVGSSSSKSSGSSSSGSTPTTVSSPGAASPSTSSSAAKGLTVPFSIGTFVGTLVASAGALVGAAFVL